MTHDPSPSGPTSAGPSQFGAVPTHLPPPNWYPDPAGSSQERYWDGTGWTGNLRDRIEPGPAPQGVNHAGPWQPGHSAGPASYPQPGPQGWTPGQSFPAGPSYGPGYSNSALPWAGHGELSGWWRRFFAYLLDAILVGFVSNMVLSPYSASVNSSLESLMNDVQNGTVTSNAELWQLMNSSGLTRWLIVSTLVGLGLRSIYFAILWRNGGASLGQRVLSIQVVDAEQATQKIGWGKAFLRAITLEVLFALPLIGLVAALVPLGTKSKQGWHDMVAKTLVRRR